MLILALILFAAGGAGIGILIASILAVPVGVCAIIGAVTGAISVTILATL